MEYTSEFDDAVVVRRYLEALVNAGINVPPEVLEASSKILLRVAVE